MPRDFRVLQVVVASPSDVKDERNALKGVIEKVNLVAKSRNLILQTSRWEDDAYAGFHIDGPQGLIDAILKIEECDIFVGMFWKKFGTPVKDARSGTEHEFKLALDAWKKRGSPQIMFYFSQKPYNPESKDETDQWGQVLEFKQHFPKEGLWFPYNDAEEFKDIVHRHMTNFILKSEQLLLGPNISGSNIQNAISQEAVQQKLDALQSLINLLHIEFPDLSDGEIYKMATQMRLDKSRATKGENVRTDLTAQPRVSH